MDEQHEIVTTPHQTLALAWVDCTCGDKMKNPATNGLVAEWARDHLARYTRRSND